MNYKIKKVKNYALELAVSFDKTDLDGYVFEAKKRLSNDLKIDGFRKGKAPLEISKDKLNPKEVLEIAFDLAFKQSFTDVLMKEKLELIDAGKFEIKENSPEKMSYKVSVTIFPEFKIGNYKNIKIDKKSVSVSQDEIDRALNFIRNSRKKDGSLPELNDDFAKTLGQFQTLEELKKSISEGIRQEKENNEVQRVQSFILDKVVQDTEVEIPSILLERQLEQMMLDLNTDLQQQGVEFGLFLAKIKKTKEELMNDWRAKAEILVKRALLLKEIAKKENIKIEEEEIKEKADGLLKGFPDIEQAEKNIDLPQLFSQIHQVLLNEKVLKFLEREAVSG